MFIKCHYIDHFLSHSTPNVLRAFFEAEIQLRGSLKTKGESFSEPIIVETDL